MFSRWSSYFALKMKISFGRFYGPSIMAFAIFSNQKKKISKNQFVRDRKLSFIIGSIKGLLVKITHE